MQGRRRGRSGLPEKGRGGWSHNPEAGSREELEQHMRNFARGLYRSIDREFVGSISNADPRKPLNMSHETAESKWRRGITEEILVKTGFSGKNLETALHNRKSAEMLFLLSNMPGHKIERRSFEQLVNDAVRDIKFLRAAGENTRDFERLLQKEGDKLRNLHAEKLAFEPVSLPALMMVNKMAFAQLLGGEEKRRLHEQLMRVAEEAYPND